jgi:hypothetical protein
MMDFDTVAVIEEQVLGVCEAPQYCVCVAHDILRNEQFCFVPSIKDATGSDAIEIRQILGITSGAEGNSFCSSMGHRAVILFIGLYTSSLLEPTVFSEIDISSNNICPRAKYYRDTVRGRKTK